MDNIISNTVIITKCLLSYKIPHQIIEKILLQAFNPEIIRYPSLYSTHICWDEKYHLDCEGNQAPNYEFGFNNNCRTCNIILSDELLNCQICGNIMYCCKFCSPCCGHCELQKNICWKRLKEEFLTPFNTLL
jgi:hypothetical protein